MKRVGQNVTKKKVRALTKTIVTMTNVKDYKISIEIKNPKITTESKMFYFETYCAAVYMGWNWNKVGDAKNKEEFVNVVYHKIKNFNW